MEGSDGHSEFDSQLTYAWNWFAYHAGQRLAAFNFFLVIVGVMAVAYGQAIVQRWAGVGIVIGGLGSLVGLGFLALDVRNKTLVDVGGDALAALEAHLDVHILLDARKHRRTSPRLMSHTTVLRTIEGLVTVVFAIAAVWAALGYPGSHPAPH